MNSIDVAAARLCLSELLRLTPPEGPALAALGEEVRRAGELLGAAIAAGSAPRGAAVLLGEVADRLPAAGGRER